MMEQIQKAKIDFVNTYKDLNVKSIQQADKLGIEATKKVVINSINLVAKIYEAVKDGFQFADLFIVPGLVSEIISIVSNIEKAKSELNDLNNDEKRILGELAISTFMTKFNVSIGGGNKQGIDNIKLLFDNLFGSIQSVKGALKDGIQIEDLFILPSLIASLVWMLINAKSVKTEFNDISKDELVTLSGLIVLYIYGVIFE